MFKKVELKLLRELEIKNLMTRVHETHIFIDETFNKKYDEHVAASLERKTLDMIPSDSESSKYLESEKGEILVDEGEELLDLNDDEELGNLEMMGLENEQLIINTDGADPMNNDI